MIFKAKADPVLAITTQCLRFQLIAALYLTCLSSFQLSIFGLIWLYAMYVVVIITFLTENCRFV